MEKLIIFGIGPLASQIVRYMKDDDRYEILAFCVEKKYMNGKTKFEGYPIIAFEDIEKKYPHSECKFLVCIGYTQMNKAREKIFIKIQKMGYEIVNYVHHSALVQAESIGSGNIFLEGCCIGNGTEIGNGNIFYAKSHVAHDCNVGDYNFFAISCAVAGNVKINNNCFFGNNCTVKNEIEISDGTLIGAATYISHNTEPWSVYVPPKSYRLDNKSSLDIKL